jgi:hypothetical protein
MMVPSEIVLRVNDTALVPPVKKVVVLPEI